MRIQSIALSSAATAVLAAGIATMPLAPASGARRADATAGVTSDKHSRADTGVTMTAPAQAMPPWPVLREGLNPLWPPATVESLQYLLDAHGAALTADGSFGPATETALVSFQRSQGIHATGVARARTWRALIVTSQLGSSGPAVRAIQEQLRARGSGISNDLTVDGIFGPRTMTAVRTFQVWMASRIPGFPVDGIVGPLTWRALVTQTP